MESPIPPLWQRQGLIIEPGLLGPAWSPHCQMPTPYQLDHDTLRLFFCSRDRHNRSHVFWADLTFGPTWQVKAVSKSPVLLPGQAGTFDAAGVMPTAIVERNGALWMYYIGWTERMDVPYHNAIGVARSHDRGQTFQRFLPGPVIGTGPHEPFFCGTGDIAKIGDNWVMWYMSATEWRTIAGRPEPRYHLKQASSEDGLNWKHGRDVAVDYLSDDEGGIARATVLPSQSGYWMWFCHRGIAGYRGKGRSAYRLGVAWSPDGQSWKRLPEHEVFSSEPKADDFDAFMACYPAVFAHEGRHYLFYNGSDFGQTGIGVAELQSYTLESSYDG